MKITVEAFILIALFTFALGGFFGQSVGYGSGYKAGAKDMRIAIEAELKAQLNATNIQINQVPAVH